MLYKDPERKRQWEREHREQRNAKRRQKLLNVPIPQEAVSASVPAKDSGSAWGALAPLALWVGLALLGAFAGVNLPNSRQVAECDIMSTTSTSNVPYESRNRE